MIKKGTDELKESPNAPFAGTIRHGRDAMHGVSTKHSLSIQLKKMDIATSKKIELTKLQVSKS